MSVVWLVLKVIGWLLLGVLALLIFTPFAVKIHYGDELRLKVGAALFGRHGIWLQILPKREKKHARKPKPKKEKPKGGTKEIDKLIRRLEREIEKQEQLIAELDDKIGKSGADYQEITKLLQEKENEDERLLDMMEQWEAAQS